jgi:hypothetical protein
MLRPAGAYILCGDMENTKQLLSRVGQLPSDPISHHETLSLLALLLNEPQARYLLTVQRIRLSKAEMV